MIGAISVRVTAGHPEAPLRPVAVIQGSAMTVEVVDAPRSGNGIAVSGVSVTVTNANGVYTTAAAIRTGSVWTATIPATAFAVSGNVDDGLAVVANGKDENGVSRSWNIGRGQLTIISAEAVPTPSTPFQNVKILTTQPTTPILGDMFYFAGDGWKIYNGSSWDDIGGRDGAKGDKGDKGDTGAAGRDGVNGVTPTIGDNGDWFIGTTDTGKPSRGEKGEKGDKGDTGSVESVAFSDITNKPTTLAGYGITDAARSADVPSVVSPSSSAAEGAAASAKATGTALAGKMESSGNANANVSFGTVTANYVTVKDDNGSPGIFEFKVGKSLYELFVDMDSRKLMFNNEKVITEGEIPIPTRVKNTDDTCRIDGEGNVYAVSKNTRGTPVATGYKAGTYTFASFNSGVSTKWICGSDANWLTYNLSTGYLYNGNVQVLLDKNIDLSVDGTKLTKDGVVVGTADNPIIIQGSSYTQSIIFYPQGEYSNETNNARLAREYPIKSLTVTSGAATALDSTINTITPTATTTIAPPTAKTIGARDWIVVVTQGSTAYGVTFSGSFVAESGFAWPTMEASKTYVFSFTEVASNKFLAAVKEVANV